VLSRQIAVDMLDRTLLASFLPVDVMRAAGMVALSIFAPLRRFAVREDVIPGGRRALCGGQIISQRDRKATYYRFVRSALETTLLYGVHTSGTIANSGLPNG
jgi:hypothetical protein